MPQYRIFRGYKLSDAPVVARKDRQIPGGAFLTGEAGKSRQLPGGAFLTEAASERNDNTKGLWLPHSEVWTRNPLAPVRIDTEHPLAEGLQFFIYPIGSVLFDAVSGKTFSKVAAVTLTASSYGPSVRIGGGSVCSLDIKGKCEVGVPISTFSITKCAASAAVKYIVSLYTTIPYNSDIGYIGYTNSERFMASFADNTAQVAAQVVSSSIEGTDTVSSFFVNYPNVGDSTTIKTYRNGSILSTTTSGTTTSGVTLEYEKIVVGNVNQGGSWLASDYFVSAMWFGLPANLSQLAARELDNNPWQLLQPKTRRVWVPNAGIPANNGRWLSKKEVCTSRPKCVSSINLNNPITKGLLSAYVFTPSLLFYDFVKQRYVKGITNTWNINLDINNSLLISGDVLELPVNKSSLVAPMSIAYGSKYVSGALGFALLTGRDTWNGWYQGGAEGIFVSTNSGADFSGNITMSGNPLNGLYNYAVTDTGTTLRGISRGGSIVVDSSHSAITAINNPTLRLCYAGGNAGTQRISHIFVWDRVLDDSELKSITDNPWQIFAPQERRIWVPTKPAPRQKGHWI